MNNLEKNAVRIVAKLSPWLAPFPSAWFVGRSAMLHLGLPWPVAMVVAAIIDIAAGDPRLSSGGGMRLAPFQV